MSSFVNLAKMRGGSFEIFTSNGCIVIQLCLFDLGITFKAEIVLWGPG